MPTKTFCTANSFYFSLRAQLTSLKNVGQTDGKFGYGQRSRFMDRYFYGRQATGQFVNRLARMRNILTFSVFLLRYRGPKASFGNFSRCAPGGGENPQETLP